MEKTICSKPFQIIIFGATGDLASLKLFPALYDMYTQKRLPENFSIIGFGRSKLSKENFRELFRNSIEKKYKASEKNSLNTHSEATEDYKKTEENLEKLLTHVEYFSGQYDQVEHFKDLLGFCKTLQNGWENSKDIIKLAYFSVPPNVFEPIIKNLAAARESEQEDLRLVVEKPFGYDAKSAAELFHVLSGNFYENQIYLLDHYLGKRSIQSILKLRMENNVINLMLKGSEIANIQITAFEKADVGQRIGYFDQVGIMKDMIQSHLLQILALITMDIPVIPSVESLQREKNNILSAVRFSGNSEDMVLGQYADYLQVEGVPAESLTDTFCALRLFIDRRDWFNVPIYIRTGKKLAESKSSIVIEFKKMPFQNLRAQPNRLIFEFKPEEKLKLKLMEDREDRLSFNGYELEEVALEQSLKCDTDHCLSEYGSLLLDILQERKINFLSFAEILGSWKVIDEVEKIRKELELKPEIYEGGSEGPENYLHLPKRDEFSWYE